MNISLALREKCPYSVYNIQSECGKIRSRKTPNTDTFQHRVRVFNCALTLVLNIMIMIIIIIIIIIIIVIIITISW